MRPEPMSSSVQYCQYCLSEQWRVAWIVAVPLSHSARQRADMTSGGRSSQMILIVDDSADIRQSVRTCIEQNTNHEVCGEAENGAEAIEKVKQLQPDLVILDYQMPVLDGLGAATQIRRLAPGIKIILFTMYGSEQMKTFARLFGVDEVVSKSDGG